MKQRVIDVFQISGFSRKIDDATDNINTPLIQARSSWVTGEKNSFVVLRRWSSYTPFMAGDATSKGGGYVLVWQGKVIVIDPGCHFYSNFRERGFRLADIHAVVVTHSHVDHTYELESLLTLLFELHDNHRGRRLPVSRQVHLFFNLGVVKKHAGWLDFLHDIRKKTPIHHINILDPRKDPNQPIWIPGTNIRLRPTVAEHHEIIAYNYSTGLFFELYDHRRAMVPKTRIGITSDTCWHQHIEDEFRGCDLLVMHLGSVYKQEFAPRNQPHHNHLGIRGCCDLLERINYRRALLSEWGEELRELRLDIIETLRANMPPGKIVNCGDIGTTVSLPDLALCCEMLGCNSTARDDDIFVEDNSVKHFCADHLPGTHLAT